MEGGRAWEGEKGRWREGKREGEDGKRPLRGGGREGGREGSMLLLLPP